MFMASLGLYFLVLQISCAEVDGSSSKALSGASLRGKRSLQQSRSTMVPRCRPGYKDVTNGQAFYWSCAFHCEGGAYYATTGCFCACLTPEQEETWRQMGGGISGGELLPAGNVSSGRILVTPPPDPTPAPYVPVREFGVGQPAGDEQWAPEVLQNYNAPTSQPMPTAPPPEESGDPGFHLGIVGLLFAGLVVCTALVGILCFNWSSLMKRFKQVATEPKIVETPVFNLQLPIEKCPQPPVDLRMSCSTSARTSISSHGSNRSRMFLAGNPKVDSKNSSGSALQSGQKDAKGLLKPPLHSHSAVASTCSGTLSGTSSMNSQTFWAQPSLIPKANSRSSSVSMGKISKVQPVS